MYIMTSGSSSVNVQTDKVSQYMYNSEAANVDEWGDGDCHDVLHEEKDEINQSMGSDCFGFAIYQGRNAERLDILWMVYLAVN